MLIAVPLAAAQDTGSIRGKVSNREGQPLAGASVLAEALHRQVQTDPTGTFELQDIPSGSYLLQISSPFEGSRVERVTVEAERTTEIEVTLDPYQVSDEIVVSAGVETRRSSELAQPINVIREDGLQQIVQSSLGETLANQKGIAASSFGPAASRPVIRGLDGERILVLQSGLGVGDASTTSPDHIVAVDPMSAERIEVIRGPATLLYGSGAVGGVVNVLDGRIPDYVPEKLNGTYDLRLGTVADEVSNTFTLNGGGGRWAWHADAFKRESADYEIPGPAKVGSEAGEEGEEAGVLENSFVDTEGGALGFSWIDDHVLVGASVSSFQSLYGVPVEEGEEGEEEEGEEEEGVHVDVDQLRYDLQAELSRGFSIFNAAKLRFALADYEHREIEEGESNRFVNDFWEGRLELVQRPRANLTGSFGIQVKSREYAALGEEEFLVPPSATDSWSAFGVQRISRGRLTTELGLRYEVQDSAPTVEVDLPERSFSGVSGSLGFTWQPVEAYALALALSRSVKFPNAEELYSEGAIPGSGTFDIGDPTLGEETSVGIDLSLRKLAGRVKGEINVFHIRFDHFIFKQFTGEEREELPVAQFFQSDANLVGAELGAQVELFASDGNRLDLELLSDYVRAELSDSGQPLPRMPPLRYTARLGYNRADRFGAAVEVRRVEPQNRTSDFETPTAGYTFLNVSLSHRFNLRKAALALLLRGNNLTDAEGRNHVSFLKDEVLLPGRDFTASLRVFF